MSWRRTNPLNIRVLLIIGAAEEGVKLIDALEINQLHNIRVLLIIGVAEEGVPGCLFFFFLTLCRL